MCPLRKLGAGFLVFAFSIFVGANEATSANVSYQTGNTQASLTISGPIAVGDLVKVREAVADLNKRDLVVFRVFLDSPGGNVEEAIRIGRYLRDIRVATVAPEKTDDQHFCASACSLVWFGGVYRIGRVRVHRAFLPDDEGALDFSDWDEVLSGSRENIRTYLSQMRIPDWVDVLLNSVASTSTKAIDGEDIGVFDPIFEEYVLSKCGDGLNSIEVEMLRALEDNEKEGLDPDPVYKIALGLLREKRDAYSACGRRWLNETQRAAQLGD